MSDTIWTAAAGRCAVLDVLDMTAPLPDRAAALAMAAKVRASTERKLRAFRRGARRL